MKATANGKMIMLTFERREEAEAFAEVLRVGARDAGIAFKLIEAIRPALTIVRDFFLEEARS